MNEKPILFKGEMVKAILEGRKTKTRRALKVQPIDILPMLDEYDGRAWVTLRVKGEKLEDNHGDIIGCRFGFPGDRLWVRETWRIVGWDEDGDWCIEYKDGSTCWFYSVQDCDEDASVRYWQQCTDDCIDAKIPEDDEGYFHFNDEHPCPTRWRPSIFMPRWASRITLEILNVRVERLQAITTADVLAEGIKQTEPDGFYLAPLAGVPDYPWTEAVPAYASLWNSINAKSGFGWDFNPWVWVIEFKRVEK